jgi:small subunit ribosomal protein S12e
MSDAGDEVQVDAAPEVEVAAEAAPKGKLSVEDALQVLFYMCLDLTCTDD